MKQERVFNIYQNKRGITFLDGYYLVRNPRTKAIAIITIAKGVVSVHEVKSQMALQELINRDAMGLLDVYESLKPVEVEKQKLKNKKND